MGRVHSFPASIFERPGASFPILRQALPPLEQLHHCSHPEPLFQEGTRSACVVCRRTLRVRLTVLVPDVESPQIRALLSNSLSQNPVHATSYDALTIADRRDPANRRNP